MGLQERVVSIKRVAKVVKGGRNFSFNAMVVVGDGSGSVGIGLGKAGEVPEAVRKGTTIARKNMVKLSLKGSTIPHERVMKYCATKVVLKPAAPGTGVIAGAGVRAVAQAAGIRDLLSKVLGSRNPINVVKATFMALDEMRLPEDAVAARKQLAAEQLASPPPEPRSPRPARPAQRRPREEREPRDRDRDRDRRDRDHRDRDREPRSAVGAAFASARAAAAPPPAAAAPPPAAAAPPPAAPAPPPAAPPPAPGSSA